MQKMKYSSFVLRPVFTPFLACNSWKLFLFRFIFFIPFLVSFFFFFFVNVFCFSCLFSCVYMVFSFIRHIEYRLQRPAHDSIPSSPRLIRFTRRPQGMLAVVFRSNDRWTVSRASLTEMLLNSKCRIPVRQASGNVTSHDLYMNLNPRIY